MTAPWRNRRLLSGTSILVAAVLLVAVNVAAEALLGNARVDLTENNLYTLSEGTRTILDRLDGRLTLKLYLSGDLASRVPQLHTYATRVRELLERYDRLAGEHIELEVIEPEPFSKEEDEALSAGLRGVPTGQGSTRLYFGLVGSNEGGKQEVIPFFQPSRERLLEYEVTELVYHLANPSKPVIGLMSSLPIQGTPRSRAWVIYQRIREQFQVEPLRPGVTEIPDKVDVLLVIHPSNLGERGQYAIDQYALRGGHVLAFVDPYSQYAANQQQQQGMMMAMQAGLASDLPRLFDAWGVKMVKNKVVGDIDAAQQVRVGQGPRPMVIAYPVWMNLGDERLAQDDVVTAQLGSVSIGTAGALKATGGEGEAGPSFEPLLTTGPRGTLYDVNQVTNLADPMSLVENYQPMQRFTLGARISGKVGAAFPEGPPEAVRKAREKGDDRSGKGDKSDKGDDQSPPEHLASAQASANIIVVADADMLGDRAWVRMRRAMGGRRVPQPIAGNGDLLANALDNLSGSDALIRVRNRGSIRRPFTALEEIRREAERKYRSKERQLRDELEKTQKKIEELQSQRSGESAGLSEKQKKTLAEFRERQVEIREELRQVQHKLREDIERVKGWARFVNIGLVPLLIVLGGGLFGLYRLLKRR